MITDRQQNILNFLMKEFINTSEPVSSELLNKKYALGVSPATIRNDMQVLMEQGYIAQPHTSAGRIPTNKAYKYFVTQIFHEGETDLPDYIFKEVESVKERVDRELKLVSEMMNSLTEISSLLSFNRIEQDSLFYVLKIIGSKPTYDKNIDVMKELLKELEDF